jgi:hypothetical protein
MLQVIGIILLAVYALGFSGLFTFIWLLSGGGWRGVIDGIIVGAVWPYVLWDWLK